MLTMIGNVLVTIFLAALILVFPIKLGLTIISWMMKKYFKSKHLEANELLQKEVEVLGYEKAKLEGELSEARKASEMLFVELKMKEENKRLKEIITNSLNYKSTDKIGKQLKQEWIKYNDDN